MPLEFDPGEAFQFDWSHELVLLAGMPVTVKVAQFTLCYSRMPFVRCYPRETQEMVFDAHDRAFAAFGGHCGRGIYDNMSTAVTRVLLGRNREINSRFLQMCAHYVITPEFCSPRAGWEKGRVERQIGTLRNVLFKPRPDVETLDCLNGQLAQQCLSHAREHPHPAFPEMSIFEVFACEERRCLVPGMAPFRGHAVHLTTASKTCLIRFDNNKYSVEARAAGRPVEVRALGGPCGDPPRRRGCRLPRARLQAEPGGLRRQSLHPDPRTQARCDPQWRAVPGGASAAAAGTRAGASGRPSRERWCGHGAHSPGAPASTASRWLPRPAPRPWRPASATPT